MQEVAADMRKAAAGLAIACLFGRDMNSFRRIFRVQLSAGACPLPATHERMRPRPIPAISFGRVIITFFQITGCYIFYARLSRFLFLRNSWLFSQATPLSSLIVNDSSFLTAAASPEKGGRSTGKSFIFNT
jgi:hypothetical protein